MFIYFFLQSVDDWKKKRRQKQKPSAVARLLESGEEEDNTKCVDRKRINRFEQSQYYLMPLNADGSAAIDPQSQQQQTDHDTAPNVRHSQHQTLPTDLSSDKTVTNTKSANTIELTGIRQEVNESTSAPAPAAASLFSMSSEDMTTTSTNELDESSLPCLVYTERTVEITRPINYVQRGFGFLLNTGVSSTGQSVITLRLADESETTVVNDSYAQVVVVEPGLDFLSIKPRSRLILEIQCDCDGYYFDGIINLTDYNYL
jgi:hypothetical protein